MQAVKTIGLDIRDGHGSSPLLILREWARCDWTALPDETCEDSCAACSQRCTRHGCATSSIQLETEEKIHAQ